jgi:hypothetical protein
MLNRSTFLETWNDYTQFAFAAKRSLPMSARSCGNPGRKRDKSLLREELVSRVVSLERFILSGK